MNNAKEVLEYLQSKNIRNFVFTHRGVTTETVLKNIGIYDYFEEIVTSLNKFKRKPDPEGINYLINKYNLVFVSNVSIKFGYEIFMQSTPFISQGESAIVEAIINDIATL